MNVITIPKNMAKNDDLVIIPRKEYEEFLASKEKKSKLPNLMFCAGPEKPRN